MTHPDDKTSRRAFIQRAAAGTVITAMGGYWLLDDELTRKARAQTREDGRPRLPPGQRVISSLRPMGGQPGPRALSDFSLRVHGEVERPFSVSFRELLEMDQDEVTTDVHCVTTWSVLGARFTGVKVKDLAERAGLKRTARHVVFESAHGYTANVRLSEALADNNLIAHRHDGRRLARPHGGPARAVIPALYFWKSAKWITGIKFVRRDEPGYWEVRGYHNHADPWREERHA